MPIVIVMVAVAFAIGIILPTTYFVSQEQIDTAGPEDNQDQTLTDEEKDEDQLEEISEPSKPDQFEPKVEINYPPVEKPVYEIIGKDIPPGYVFGNIHDNGIKTGMMGTPIESSDQKNSIRFTNQYDGTINKISLSITPGEEREIKLGIQEDNGFGNPTGQWIENGMITNSTGPGIRVYPFNFEPGIKLEKDKVYHIVLEPTQDEGPSKTMYVTTFQSNVPGRPLNLEDPDIYSDDPFLNSLFYDGSKWIEQDRWPIFLLTYDDGRKDGQPYSLAAAWTIRGSVHVGQTLIPASDYLISKFGMVVGKNGNPPAPLIYGIKDSQNNILSEGTFAEADELQRFSNWVEVTLDEPVLLSAGELYRIFLYSEIPKADDIYELYGHEFSFDRELGYGALRHRLTISHDDGQTWAAWNDADVLFKITTAE